jgi:hypothetical protein
MPGRNAGFASFHQCRGELLLRALRSGIADIVMGKTGFDWIADCKRLQSEGDAPSLAAGVEIDAKQAAGAAPSLPLSAYAGHLARPLVWRHRDRGARRFSCG